MLQDRKAASWITEWGSGYHYSVAVKSKKWTYLGHKLFIAWPERIIDDKQGKRDNTRNFINQPDEAQLQMEG